MAATKTKALHYYKRAFELGHKNKLAIMTRIKEIEQKMFGKT